MSCDYCWPGNCCGGPNCMDGPAVPAGWRPIDEAAQAAGEINVHRFGKYGWMHSVVGTWRSDPDGLSGWFNRAGEYLSPVPTHWKPLSGGAFQ